MKICVISDSHGYKSNIEKVLLKNYDYVIFCGDGVRDFDEDMLTKTNIIMVEGNCDLYSQYPLEENIILGGKKFIICHGHTYNVKGGIIRLMAEAFEKGVDVVCYGHTHIQNVEIIDGVYFINPGSLATGRAIEINITGDTIVLSKITI